jgi:hypothetical protein
LLNAPAKSNISLTKILSDRFTSWKSGNYVSLWSSIAPFSPSGSRDPLARAKTLASAGEYGKACAALVPSVRSPTDLNTLASLQAKHPKGPPVKTLADLPNSVLEIPHDVVRKMIYTFPTGSSPGPMGLRAEHIKPCLKSHLDFLDTLTRFINLLLSGKVLNSLARYLAGASLSALEKKDGGIRPLACGNLLRRLTSKCVCSVFKDQFRDFLMPHQVGVAVPGGAEIVVHEARRITEIFQSRSKYKDFGFLKIDFKNAFNEVSRQAIYDELVENFPQIIPYFNWCYADPTVLFFGDFQVSSEVGVQQGDPLGPCFFSLVLRKLILEIEKKFTPRWNRWYLDDGNIGSDFESLSGILNLIDDLGPKLGLYLNRSKCQIYGFQNPPPESIFPHVEIGKSSDFDTLGAPIGSPDFCSKFVSKKLLQTYNILDLLPKLNNAQIAFTLLRTCCSFGKVVYFLRTIPSNLIENTCKEFDKKIMLCFEDVLSISPDAKGAIQVSLPLSKGGTGLRSASNHAPACYIASMSSARTFAKTKSNLSLKIPTLVYDSFNKLVRRTPFSRP